MADLLDFGGVRVFTPNGQPGAGYVARFFQSGTTTPVIVYTDASLGTAFGTSVTADAAGRFPAVWSAGRAIKCVIADANGATQQTIDPVISFAASNAAAGSVTFAPTVALPFDNVQDAIVGAARSAASGFSSLGLGITGNATLLAGLDATNIPAGVYRFDGTTTGTFPTGVAAADTGLVETWRQSAGTAMQFLYHATTDRVFHRRLSTTWQAWREIITAPQGAVEGDLLFRAASAWARLAKGTAGQTLVMNSGATAPEWVAPGFNCVAWVNFHGVATNGTYSRTGNTVTVTMTAHGMATGMIANLDFTSGAATDGSYAVTVTGVNTYTITDPASGATSGNVTRNTFIRASGNVSSITDNGTGDYTVNFTNALADANYAVSFGGMAASPTIIIGGMVVIAGASNVANLKTTTQLRVQTGSSNTGGLFDAGEVHVAIFR